MSTNVLDWLNTLKSFDAFKELMDFRTEVMLATHSIVFSRSITFSYVYGVKPKLGEDWDLTRDEFLNDVEKAIAHLHKIVENKFVEFGVKNPPRMLRYKRTANSLYTEHGSKIFMINGSHMNTALKGLSSGIVYYSGDPRLLREYYPYYKDGKLPNTYTPIWEK